MNTLRNLFNAVFGLTAAEEDQARADAGKPWRTGYYVAGRDMPVPAPDLPTREEAYEAIALMRAQEGRGRD